MNRSKIGILMGISMVFLALAPGPENGTITGLVKSRWAKRFPMVVFIEKANGDFKPPAKEVIMDQKNKVFVPRVMPLLKGTKVGFLNSDSVEHNVFCPDGEAYDLGNWGQGEKRSHTFTKTGIYTQLCRLHPEMVAYAVVLDNPYFAVTDKEGHFTIKDVPPGTYKLKVWGERLKKKRLKKTFDVTVESGKEVKVKLKP